MRNLHVPLGCASCPESYQSSLFCLQILRLHGHTRLPNARAQHIMTSFSPNPLQKTTSTRSRNWINFTKLLRGNVIP